MNKWIWIAVVAVLVGFVYLTKAVLLPFLVGLAVAYFLDPVADFLEKHKFKRGTAAALVITLFFLIVIAVLLAMWPLLRSQFFALADTLPATLARLRPVLNELFATVNANFGLSNTNDVEGMLGGASEQILTQIQKMAAGLLKSGLAIFNFLTLVLISPVVAFYLLRDWDLIVDRVNTWLPPLSADIIRKLATEVDSVLAGFVRGQMLVSSIMGILYAVGWSLAGLNFAIILGLLAGIMSFIPFVGALFAAVIAVAIGIGQWGLDPIHLLSVASVFFVVQLIEGAFLTPRLIGESVGLHPVWVLFAVFAGGEIMGFAGVLIAVPAAASIAVLVRFAVDQYMNHYQINAAAKQEPEKE